MSSKAKTTAVISEKIENVKVENVAEEKSQQDSVRDEVQTFLFAETRRQKAIKFVTDVTKKIEVTNSKREYLLSVRNNALNKLLLSWQDICIDFGGLTTFQGRILREDLHAIRCKLLMAQHAFTKADEGFFQAYQISLARYRQDRLRRGGAMPPCDTAEELWRRLEAGEELARQQLHAEHVKVHARIQGILRACPRHLLH